MSSILSLIMVSTAVAGAVLFKNYTPLTKFNLTKFVRF